LDHLQVERAELEVEYWKVEANQKSLEFVVAPDVCKLTIATDRAKHFEKEIVDLNVRLSS